MRGFHGEVKVSKASFNMELFEYVSEPLKCGSWDGVCYSIFQRQPPPSGLSLYREINTGAG